ncbi:hypothetical protein L1857_26075 [Amycolatopsis thermalba]|uniref:PIN domain-containing protein n=1 Tax=Amycolatopsis thermalba TaxID=944492 RepID=A0ABY4P188_9PSEU|nr:MULTISPECIES: hypothetical protein [Amycolatopsis]UQS26031.1 hypothetical protein L1857_26075 [Amycolatopsis thermalba]
MTPLTVYLDQCHWVTMARSVFTPEKILNKDELAAADALWRYVRQGYVRLPLSSAHLVETAHAGAANRRRMLAEAMLDAYDGWHMRHPIDVRRAELSWSLRGASSDAVRADDVFSQKPGTPFLAEEYVPYNAEDSDLPGWARRQVEIRSWRDAWAATLLTETMTTAEQDHADAVIGGWAASYQELAEYMRDHPADRDIRLVAAVRTAADLMQEISAEAHLAGLTRQQFSAWLQPERTIELFAGLPFVGRIMEITYQRLRNPQRLWKRNDLNDIMYLACAAGYADAVVIEKDLAHHLTTGEARTTPGAVVLRNLRELRGHIRAMAA